MFVGKDYIFAALFLIEESVVRTVGKPDFASWV